MAEDGKVDAAAASEGGGGSGDVSSTDGAGGHSGAPPADDAALDFFDEAYQEPAEDAAPGGQKPADEDQGSSAAGGQGVPAAAGAGDEGQAAQDQGAGDGGDKPDAGNWSKALQNEQIKRSKLEQDLAAMRLELAELRQAKAADAAGGDEPPGKADAIAGDDQAIDEVLSALDEIESREDSEYLTAAEAKSLVKGIKALKRSGSSGDVAAVQKRLDALEKQAADRERLADADQRYSHWFDQRFETLAGKGDEYLSGAITSVQSRYPKLQVGSERFNELAEALVLERAERDGAAAGGANGRGAKSPPPSKPSRQAAESPEGTAIVSRGASTTASAGGRKQSGDDFQVPDFWTDSPE